MINQENPSNFTRMGDHDDSSNAPALTNDDLGSYSTLLSTEKKRKREDKKDRDGGPKKRKKYKNVLCFGCHERGHMKRDCPYQNAAMYQRGSVRDPPNYYSMSNSFHPMPMPMYFGPLVPFPLPEGSPSFSAPFYAVPVPVAVYPSPGTLKQQELTTSLKSPKKDKDFCFRCGQKVHAPRWQVTYAIDVEKKVIFQKTVKSASYVKTADISPRAVKFLLLFEGEEGMPFYLTAPCKAEIVFPSERKLVEIKRKEDEPEQIPLYYSTDAVVGVAKVTLNNPSKKVEHHGISITLIGQIEMFYDRGDHFEFTSVSRELAPAGVLSEAEVEFPFEFKDIEKQYESYNGINVRLRYFIRVHVNVKNSLSDCTCEQDLWVNIIQPAPEINNSLKMEVGIEDTLHIEFEYQQAKYDLKGVIIGKIYFLLIRLKIKHMELALLRRESAGSGPSLYNETETLLKYEIMEGAPVRGESVPVRLFLGGVDLTPTYRNVASKFSVKYYLNLVLIDQDDRRYFKQQEIILWRKD